MYVLVAAPRLSAWPRLEELLSGLGLRLERTADASELLMVAACEPPSVALVDAESWPWAEPILTDHGEGAPLLYVSARDDDDAPFAAAGAVSASAAGEEVALQLMALAMNAAQSTVGATSFVAWSAQSMARLDDLLSSEFGGMLGLSVRAEPADPDLPLELCAEIHLTLPDHGAEVVLGLGFDAASASALSVLLFGEDLGLEMMRDAVQEFANTAGGAVKRAAHRDGLTFSLGLPTPDIAHIHDAIYGRRLIAEAFSLSVWAHTLQLDDTHKRVCDLQEGAVLAEAVLGADGSVLAEAGAVVTHDTMRRLGAELDDDAVVLVSRAA